MEAIEEPLEPAIEELEEPTIVDNLLEKMDACPGFASVGAAVQSVSRLVDEDGDHKDIITAILLDPALTSKLLKMANSSRYPRGAGNVSTINQALAILGVNTVKSVILSLSLLKSLPHKQQSNRLYAEIVAGFFSGMLAAAITRGFGIGYGVQEAQVCGIIQNLGRMMSVFYLYDEIERIRDFQIKKNIEENDAVIQILGLSFEEVGCAIADHWGLPDLLQNCLLPDTVVAKPAQPVSDAMAWHRLCSLLSRRITEILFRLPEAKEKAGITTCINFFKKSLNLNEKEAHALVDKCLLETESMLSEMSFPCNVVNARSVLRKASERSMDKLLAQDSLMQEDKDGGRTPIELVKYLMRLIHSHCNFDCTLICMPAGAGLSAIAGVGRNSGQLTTRFRSNGMKKDIFQLIIERKINTFIPDVHQPPYASLIPAWYHEVVGAQSLTLLPLVNEGKLVGLIYGDYSKSRGGTPSELTDENMQGWRTTLINILSGLESK